MRSAALHRGGEQRGADVDLRLGGHRGHVQVLRGGALHVGIKLTHDP
jgi:hypothetical protein